MSARQKLARLRVGDAPHPGSLEQLQRNAKPLELIYIRGTQGIWRHQRLTFESGAACSCSGMWPQPLTRAASPRPAHWRTPQAEGFLKSARTRPWSCRSPSPFG